MPGSRSRAGRLSCYGDVASGALSRLCCVAIAIALGAAGNVCAQQGNQIAAPHSASSRSSSAQTNSSSAEKPVKKLKIGPLDIAVNWRVRAEGWDWFVAATGENEYAFAHSLLRVGVGRTGDRFEWLVEGAQDAILALPGNAVAAGAQGQLGLGGTYFVANGNRNNNANAFVKQAYVRVKRLGPMSMQVGRFEYLDGMETTPTDKTLAALVETRIAQRLIGNFGWSAVGRSYDGAHLSFDSGANNLTLIGARVTRGVYQADAMGELSVNVAYGAYNRQVNTRAGAGALRIFGIGYFDGRDGVVKTDSRPALVRNLDHSEISIGTYGANYLHVVDARGAGKFDFVLWGVLQNGAWGAQSQRASAFIAEAGWQPKEDRLKPWLSFGVSRGSGDKDTSDSVHGTFFQILPTPRPYARFPFWNMQNNEDFYASIGLQPGAKWKLRSELHALRLANANDLWYLGGGAFQAKTFGYTGRPGNGNRSLANMWDLSADYQMTRNFSVGLYYARARGKAVVQSIYPKNGDGQMAYLETSVKF